MLDHTDRDAEAVLRDHLDRRKRGDLEGDLANNFADSVVVLAKDGVFKGKDGIRTTAGILQRWMPDATFSYDLILIEGELALLSWSAKSPNGGKVCHGADSFIIRNGKIVGQTIHFEVGDPGAPSSTPARAETARSLNNFDGRPAEPERGS